MNSTIQFAMGIHNHQPVGNFKSVFDEAFSKAYMPFLDCLERHPSIKATIHNTGPLYDEYLREKPQWIKKIRELSKNGQIELLSGAYYEPILINIADRDKIAQIKKMNRIIKRETNQKARGIWCAERIWEPALAKPVNLSDIQYTILDETHFRSSGMEEKDIFGYYVTEEQGYPLSVFPINYNLRLMIPYKSPEEIIDYLKKWATPDGKRLAVFADDGEKFGLWPGSFKAVWEERWMDRFFDLLEKNSSWIKTVNFSEYLDSNRPLGRVYLPAASYFEMSSWALPLKTGRAFRKAVDDVSGMGRFDEFSTFLKGGFWRNFLVKYPQSNRIQKKALFVSEKIQKMMQAEKADAENELFKGQCNCAYWHGVFGGIYLPHLRHAVQESLIRAEEFADREFHRGRPYKEVLRADLNCDLQDEVLINTKNLRLSFLPHQGGVLEELDYKPLCINLCDTITRREEIYHDQPDILPSDNDAKTAVATDFPAPKLIIDKYERYSFIDHFLADDVKPMDFWKCRHEELGDFVEAPNEIFTSEKDDKAVLTLSRKGSVKINGNPQKAEVEKTFFVPEDGNSFQVQYWIMNDSDEDMEISFASELNFSFLSKDFEMNHLQVQWEEELEGEDESVTQTERIPLDSVDCQEDLEEIVLVDGHRGYRIIIDFGTSADCWHMPVETLNKKLEGFETVYQSTIVMPVWKVKIEPGDSWDNTVNVRIEEIKE